MYSMLLLEWIFSTLVNPDKAPPVIPPLPPSPYLVVSTALISVLEPVTMTLVIGVGLSESSC